MMKRKTKQKRNNSPYGRDVHGILLIDKPYGVSSNYILQKVKCIYGANRAGHTGTLDPLATGMLPICFGEATKFSQYSLDADKRYRTLIQLGQRTDTSDKEGRVVRERPINFTIQQLNTALASFHGNIMQIPSMYSALKYKGKKLYEYARLGISIPRKARKVTIYQLSYIRYEYDKLELEIHCSKGTYIRTIIDDLGEMLGCGAHIIQLHRLEVDKYPIKRMVTLKRLYTLIEQAKKRGILKAKLLDPLLIPIDSAVLKYPVVNISLTSSFFFKHGNPINISDITKEGLVRVTEGNEKNFIGIGKIDKKGCITPHRLIKNHVM